MKKLLLGIVVVIGAWCAYSYATTGTIALPVGARSADEQKIDALGRRLAQAQSEFRRANLAAGSSGLDTTANADAAMAEVQAVLDEVRGLLPEIADARVRSKAEALERRATDILAKSR